MMAFFLHALIVPIQLLLKESAHHSAPFGALVLHLMRLGRVPTKEARFDRGSHEQQLELSVPSAFSATVTVKRFLSLYPRDWFFGDGFGGRFAVVERFLVEIVYTFRFIVRNA